MRCWDSISMASSSVTASLRFCRRPLRKSAKAALCRGWPLFDQGLDSRDVPVSNDGHVLRPTLPITPVAAFEHDASEDSVLPLLQMREGEDALDFPGRRLAVAIALLTWLTRLTSADADDLDGIGADCG